MEWIGAVTARFCSASPKKITPRAHRVDRTDPLEGLQHNYGMNRSAPAGGAYHDSSLCIIGVGVELAHILRAFACTYTPCTIVLNRTGAP